MLPGERVENCFLVLDLLNRTGEEMELTYAGKKQLQIETGDVCRYVLWLFVLIFQNMIDISSIFFCPISAKDEQPGAGFDSPAHTRNLCQ